jgi:hypothetical protein
MPLPLALASTLPPVPVSSDYQAALGRLGLVPKRLAAAGLSAQNTTTLVSHLRTYLDDHLQDLQTADAAFASARVEYDRLLRLVQAGTATNDDRFAWTAAQATFVSATAARQTVLNAVFSAATADVGQDALVALNTVNTNSNTWDLPVEYLASGNNEHDWVTLREALADVRIATSGGLAPSEHVSQIVAGFDAAPATATARANIVANLATVTEAWNNAVR